MKRSLKSLTALLIILSLVLSLAPVGMVGYADGPVPTISKQIIEKNPDGTMKIELTISGKSSTTNPETNAIVLVIDSSGSMDYDYGERMASAKRGAKAFVDAVLDAENKKHNQVAVVDFDSNARIVSNFTNDARTAKSAINGLEAGGGTHTQGGLHKAYELLNSVNADHKHIVILSDGDPTYSYEFNDYSDPSLYQYDYYSGKYFSRPDLPASAFNYRFGSTYGSGNADEYFIGYPNYYVLNSNQAISEAEIIKYSGITIHSIAYGVYPGSDAEITLSRIASSGYFHVGTKDIVDIFKHIATQIYEIKEAVISDKMSEHVELVVDDQHPITNDQGNYSIIDGDTIEWKIAPVKGKATLTYYVRAKADFESKDGIGNEIYTNDKATLIYKDKNGSTQPPVDFPKPKAEVARITYKQDDGAGAVTKVYNYIKGAGVNVKTLSESGIPQKQGHSFVNWKEEGSNTTYEPGSNISTLTGSKTLIAQWKENESQWITITVAANPNGTVTGNGGNLSVAIIKNWHTWKNAIERGGFRPVPNGGYVFDKWTKADGTTVTDDMKFTEPTTVYANFKEDSNQWITVSAKTEDSKKGTVEGSSQRVPKGTEWSAIENKFTYTAKPGYEFKGWFDGAVKVSGTHKFNKTTELVAKFEKNPFDWVQVSAKSENEGKGTVTGGPENVFKGTKWSEIKNKFSATPKNGYKFAGWYANGTLVKDTTEFRFNTELIAKFDQNPADWITISAKTEDQNKGTVTGSPVLVSKGTKWSEVKNNFTQQAKRGYEFKGWYVGNKAVNDSTIFSVTTEVIAVFQVKASDWVSISVTTEDPNKGTVAGGPVNVLKGTTWSGIKDKFVPTPKPGYEFKGWYVNGLQIDDNTIFNNPTTVTAKFDVKATEVVRILYKYEDKAGALTKVFNYTKGTNAKVKSLAEMGLSPKQGYTFVNWKEEGSGVTYNPGDNISTLEGSKTLIAQWAKNDTQKIKVVYKYGEGSTAVQVFNYNKGSDVTVKSLRELGFLQKPGYTFVNWKEEGSNTTYNPGEKITALAAPKTLVAQWRKNEPQLVKISVTTEDPNKGTVAGGPVNVNKGTKWSEIKNKFIPTANPGYEFKGWYVNGSPIDDNTSFDNPTTVIAKFDVKPAEVVRISYKYDDKAGALTKVYDYNKGSEAIVKSLAEMGLSPKQGYTFVNWKEEGSNVTYNPGEKISTMAGSKTLIAQWVKKESQRVTISAMTEDPKKGTVAGDPLRVLKGSKWSEIKDKFIPTANPGYEFKGWYVNGSPINDNTSFNDATIVIAKFDVKPAEVVRIIYKYDDKADALTKVYNYNKGSEAIVKTLAEMGLSQKPGYTFVNWKEEGSGVIYNPGEKISTMASSRTLIAQWVKKESQRVTISAMTEDPKKGTVAGDPLRVLKGSKWSEIKDKFIPTANPGYEFKGWYVNGSPINDNTSFNDATIVIAKFDVKNGEWVTISATTEEPNRGTVAGGPVDVVKGTKWSEIKDKFTQKAKPGYEFKGWYVNDSLIDDNKSFDVSTIVIAKFDIKNSDWVQVSAKSEDEAKGTVTGGPEKVIKGTKWSEIKDKFTQKAKQGYEFKGWYVNNSLIDDNTSFSVPTIVTAKFDVKNSEWVKITAQSEDSSKGSANGSKDVIIGTKWSEIKSNFTAKANPGYEFDDWYIGNNRVTDGTVFKTPITVVAKFTLKDADWINISAKSNDENMGTVSGSTVKALPGTKTWGVVKSNFKPQAKAGYVLDGYYVNDVAIGDDYVFNTTTIVIVKFKADNQSWVTVTGEPENKDMGTVEGGPEKVIKGTKWSEISGKFMPKAKAGYRFVRWQVKGTNNEIPAGYEFKENTTVIAKFEKVDGDWITIKVDTKGNGTVGGNPAKIVKNRDDWAKAKLVGKFTQSANPGYVFTGWTLADGTPVAEDKKFDKDTTVYANFAKNNGQWIEITVLSKGNGTVTPNSLMIVKNTKKWEDIAGSFTLKPSKDFAFDKWTLADGTSPYGKAMFGAKTTIYANFKYVGGGGLIINPGGDSGGGGSDGGGGSSGGGGNSGGGGGGSYREYNPGVVIEDNKTPLGRLNYSDHFAYIQGYPTGDIRGTGLVTREETAAIFFRLLDKNYRETIRSYSNNFKDMSAANWSNKHVSTLVKGGIVTGYSNGTFNPRKPITRAELAAIAAKFDKLELNATHTFSDARGHWAEKYIASAASKGWISGYPDGTFRPNQSITRSEFVTFVNNVLGRHVRPEDILPGVRHFTDLSPGQWYYTQMTIATNSYLFETDPNNKSYQKWTELVNALIEM